MPEICYSITDSSSVSQYDYVCVYIQQAIVIKTNWRCHKLYSSHFVKLINVSDCNSV